MKCSQCGASWTNNANQSIMQCPFCGASLKTPTTYDTVIDALTQIIDRFGQEIYNDGRRLHGLLSDLVPSLSKERNMLKTAISAGIPGELLNVSVLHTDRESTIRNCYSLVENLGMEEKWCAVVVYIFAAPLDIETLDIFPIDSDNSKKAKKIVKDWSRLSSEDVHEYEIKDAAQLEDLADQGDAGAATELAERYFWGNGVEKDEHRAAIWLRRAAASMYPTAQFMLGQLYILGKGVEQDYQKAFELTEKAANQGYAIAKSTLGEMLYNGEGCEKDTIRAVALLEESLVDDPDPQTYLLLAVIYSNADEPVYDTANAFQFTLKAAEQDEPIAQNLLGAFYEMGTGVVADQKKAVFWFDKAAKQGYELAYLNLGAHYAQGMGVEKDEVKAAQYYQLGADSGNMYCLNALGMCYRMGTGVNIDYTKAFDLFLQAAFAGNFAGAINLAVAYEKGEGVEVDSKEARKWLEMAADYGSSKAMGQLGMYCEKEDNDLPAAFSWYKKAAEVGDDGLVQWIVGNCYANGLMGVVKDHCVAHEWYEKAAHNGHATSQNNIAVNYMQGVIVDLDYQLASEWYEKAVAQNDMYAQANYAIMLFNGEGVNRDVQRAFKLLIASAEQGYVEAQYNLGIMYFEGWGTDSNLDEALKWLSTALTAGKRDAVEYLEKGFKQNSDGSWKKKGLFGRVPAPSPLPSTISAREANCGCDDMCEKSNFAFANEYYGDERHCYCLATNCMVFKKTKCPYYKSLLDCFLEDF